MIATTSNRSRPTPPNDSANTDHPKLQVGSSMGLAPRAATRPRVAAHGENSKLADLVRRWWDGAAVALALVVGSHVAGCVPGVDLPPIPTAGRPEPTGSEPTGHKPEVVCEGVPSVEGTDPCCAVHQCLLAAEDAACELLEECRDLAPADVVCGDQLCDGVECSECQ